MIYSWGQFVVIIAVIAVVHLNSPVSGLILSHGKSLRIKRTLALQSVPDWLVGEVESKDQQVQSTGSGKTITVRFTNTPSGKDVVVTDVPEGENLLFLGDQNGVSLPRACRTGLCGSCTCEIHDPAAVSSTGVQGQATIRACSTRCYVPPGKEELIVDLWRMKNMQKKKTIKSNAGGSAVIETESEMSFSDPMARFSGDWERDFRPQWESASSKATTAAVTRTGAAIPDGQRECTKCGGKGRVECYACSGTGTLMMGNGESMQCQTCMGLSSCGCGFCQGTGFRPKKKSF